MIDHCSERDVEFVRLPFQYVKERRRGVGIIAPFDFALDDELLRWLPSGIPLYVTRTVRLENTKVTTQLAEEVSEASAVVPAVRSLISASPSSVAYACTSGSFVNGTSGERELCEIMRRAGAINPVTTSGALLRALKKLKVSKLSIATPYNEELSRLLVDFLEANNIKVMKVGYLNSEHDIMHIDLEAVRMMADAVDHVDAEAIFFSCTNLRTFEVIEELERKLGKPVLSANQVTMWSSLVEAQLVLPDCRQKLFMS